MEENSFIYREFLRFSVAKRMLAEFLNARNLARLLPCGTKKARLQNGSGPVSMRKHESLEARVASARDYVVLLFLRQVDEANRIA